MGRSITPKYSEFGEALYRSLTEDALNWHNDTCYSVVHAITQIRLILESGFWSGYYVRYIAILRQGDTTNTDALLAALTKDDQKRIGDTVIALITERIERQNITDLARTTVSFAEATASLGATAQVSSHYTENARLLARAIQANVDLTTVYALIDEIMEHNPKPT